MKINEYIKQHTAVGYCEAIIYADGTIEDCIPSHMEKLIAISKESREELMDMMPMDAGPVEWLICHTNVVALWYDFCIYNKMSDVQKESIKLLIQNKILPRNYRCVYTAEKERLETRKKYREKEIREEEFEKIMNSYIVYDSFID